MMVQTDGLNIGYHNKTVGQDINFVIPEKNIICLLGANGCGKTTLLKTLLGLLPPLSGTIEINHRALSVWTQRELSRFIAYVPQANYGIFPFTVEEVVLMGRTAHMSWLSIPRKADKAIADEALATLGIYHLKHSRYTELSGGERQLTLIARAIAQQPKLLIMDEPAASLDFGNQIRILEQVNRLKQLGISVLMSTHHPQHAVSIADNVALIFEGKLLAQGAPEKILQADKLAQIYRVSIHKIEENLPTLFSQR
jgi:iron complex transport system ATP-binding protein